MPVTEAASFPSTSRLTHVRPLCAPPPTNKLMYRRQTVNSRLISRPVLASLAAIEPPGPPESLQPVERHPSGVRPVALLTGKTSRRAEGLPDQGPVPEGAAPDEKRLLRERAEEILRPGGFPRAEGFAFPEKRLVHLPPPGVDPDHREPWR